MNEKFVKMYLFLWRKFLNILFKIMTVFLLFLESKQTRLFLPFPDFVHRFQNWNNYSQNTSCYFQTHSHSEKGKNKYSFGCVSILLPTLWNISIIKFYIQLFRASQQCIGYRRRLLWECCKLTFANNIQVNNAVTYKYFFLI